MCGGCRVRLLEGTLTPTPKDKLALTDEEIAAGWRLACQARVETAIKLQVEQGSVPILGDYVCLRGSARTGLGIAIDVGTTTLVAQMVELATGDLVGVETALNPQTAFGADIMSRVRFAMTKPDLTPLIREVVGNMVSRLAAGRESEVGEAVLVGNTVMHHLFAGIDVEPLSHVPFASSQLGEQRFTPQEVNWELPRDCRIRFVSCIGGFVGADVLAGIQAVSMNTGTELTALIDLGTNGEIAIGNRDRSCALRPPRARRLKRARSAWGCAPPRGQCAGCELRGRAEVRCHRRCCSARHLRQRVGGWGGGGTGIRRDSAQRTAGEWGA